MSSDRARVSYDPKRDYRSVVAQQGRVTLEADVNEAQEIAGEILRTETIDIVGPCGTPDDGYKISAVAGSNPGHDFKVGHGTMYVGGERVGLPGDITYSGQPEWLDHDGDPLWPAANTAAKEFVYLLLREQEVSAVEDTALREVALGGPDSAQRKRLLQRVVRMTVTGDTCAASLQTAKTSWSAAGLNFDAASMMLTSPARLKVALVNPPTTGNVCEPQAQGGYLGADNQLIRVQISAIGGNGGKLVWGYNNASFLHRVKLDVPNSTQLDFLTTPVDSYHAPRSGHPIELLRCALQLSDDPAINVMQRDYVAAHPGLVVASTHDYSSDLKTLILPTALPANYSGAATPLFLRLWEEELPFSSGQPVTLTGTGLTVTITFGGSAGALTVGQYWMFAARPNTPAEVYPHRYLFAPQPPEGPRLWACPLATIGWTQNTLSVLDDCREPFDNLVELTKRHAGTCCGITVGPDDVGGGARLQDLLDRLKGQKTIVSLQAGRYELNEPLTIGREHSYLTLEGCNDGVVIAAKSGAENNFTRGLIQLARANDVTLRRLWFDMPLAQLDIQTLRSNNIVPTNAISIGVMSLDCPHLSIAECLFSFPGKVAGGLNAAGIYLIGEHTGLTVERNRFVHRMRDKATGTILTIGVMAMSGIAAGSLRETGRKLLKAQVTSLDDARITRNEFEGLTMAVYARAEFGYLFCDDNLALGCNGGFYFLSTDLSSYREMVAQAHKEKFDNDAEQTAYQTAVVLAQGSNHMAALDFAKYVPLGAEYDARATLTIGKSLTAAESKIAATEVKDRLGQIVGWLGEHKAAHPVAEKAPPPAGSETEKVEAMKASAPPEQQASANAKHIREQLAQFSVAVPMEQLDLLVPHLRVSGNVVDILPVGRTQSPDNVLEAPPLALYVVISNVDGASVAVSTNNLRGNSEAAPLAVVELLGVTTVTGNMILNAAGEKNKGVSLILMAYPPPVLMNVAGNAFRGMTHIFPPNPADAGCAAVSWDALNSRRG
jgi:Family of unknown function (DUF6519)